jgi:acyl-CoA synthetase (AMP-forming)/AMP-acid ligase II
MTRPASLNQHFESALLRFASDRVAFATDNIAVTYGELSASVDRLAAGLAAQGIGPRSVVGYSLPNCPEAISLFLALARLGASAVPLHPMIPDVIRAGMWSSLGCALVVMAGPSSAGLPQAAERMRAAFRVVDIGTLGSVAGDGGSASSSNSDQPLLAAASSGTTGAPKSVWMTQRNVAAALTAAADMARLGDWRDDPGFSSVATFPLSTSGVLVSLGLLFNGVRLIFPRDLSPVSCLEVAAHHQVEALSAPPSYFEALLGLPERHSRPLPSLRAVLTGMDSLAPSLLRRLSQRFPGLDRAASGYGLVETSTVFMTWKAHDREELGKPPNVFTLCPEVENQVEVRDEEGRPALAGQPGELCARGPSVVSGYLGQAPELLAPFADGWFRTGDEACRIDGRTVELHGRRKYLIKRGGKSISPLEVQDRVEACPGVLSSAVVGVRQPLYGEMIWAFVVADPSRPAPLKDVMQTCRATLPNYMVPDRVTFVAELPRGSGAGKIDREALIRQAESELGIMQGETHG